jgi:uncharacterized membrane protein
MFPKEVTGMKKLGRRGRLWLRSFHILFFGTWIGAALSATIIPFIADSASDSSALYAYYEAVQLLDSIIIPCAVLTLVTGLLLCWLTAWGFFKNGWVIYSEVVAIVAILLGVIWLGPGIADLMAISEAEGLSALQNPEYTSAWNTVTIFGIIQPVILISSIFISLMKPWRNRDGVEPSV